jgi:hypothetical protein
VYYGWLAALVAFALVILNVDLLLAGTAKTALRLVLGSILFAEGTLLMSNSKGARTALLTRLILRPHGKRGVFRIGTTVWMRAGATTLVLFGLVFLGAGFFDLLRGAIDA